MQDTAVRQPTCQERRKNKRKKRKAGTQERKEEIRENRREYLAVSLAQSCLRCRKLISKSGTLFSAFVVTTSYFESLLAKSFLIASNLLACAHSHLLVAYEACISVTCLPSTVICAFTCKSQQSIGPFLPSICLITYTDSSLSIRTLKSSVSKLYSTWKKWRTLFSVHQLVNCIFSSVRPSLIFCAIANLSRIFFCWSESSTFSGASVCSSSAPMPSQKKRKTEVPTNPMQVRGGGNRTSSAVDRISNKQTNQRTKKSRTKNVQAYLTWQWGARPIVD